MQLIARQYFAAATAQEASRESSGRIYRNDDDDDDDYSCLARWLCFFLLVSMAMAERDACFTTVESMCRMCRTFAKTLKFVEHPNAEEVLQQVELTLD